MAKIKLNEITGGALQEQFAKAFEKVLANLADPNTSYKDTRKITITLTFKQNERRDDVVCDLLVSEKLAMQTPTRTAFAVGKNLKTGEYYAEEYGRNQMSMNFEVDTESGEVLEDPPAKVLNLRHCN